MVTLENMLQSPFVICVVLCRAQAENLFRQQAQRDVDRIMAAKQQEELK